MPPKVKFQKEDVVRAAVELTRQKGFDALNARDVAAAVGSSTRPIFTYFDSMEALKAEVFGFARALYGEYIERGLRGKVPNLGVGQQFIRFAREEPEFFKLLFLTKPYGAERGAVEELAFTQGLVRESIMRIYNMDAATADRYFRDLWLFAFSFATLIVTDDCPYSDSQISTIFTEMSLSLCKAIKEIPGFCEGTYDKDTIFKNLVKE